MTDVAPKEILMWQEYFAVPSMSMESRMHSSIAEASGLAKAMLTSLLFYDFVPQT